MSTQSEERQRFSAALRRHMRLLGLSQNSLALRLGAAQSAVSAWATAKSIPNPERIFALEEIFEVAPGSLASLVNYRAPDESGHRCEVVQAIEDNNILSRAHKELLLTMYASLIELDAGHPRRRPDSRS
jgi:transcriptional regulator with XRE-family HTH domain